MEKPSLLLRGCEKRPAAPNLTYRPQGGIPYRVQNRDTWWTLARRPEATAAGVDALGLCVFNFGTRVPAEINWYLRNKVGCTHTTQDRKNYVFSGDATPGVIYLPGANSVTPPPPGPTPPADKLKLNSWIGLGGKFGSTVIVTGIEQVGGFMVSIQDLVNTEPQVRTIAFNIQTTRLGIGVGASGGACIIYATSLRNAAQLNSLLTGGGDWNLALGGNAGALIKGAKWAGKLKHLQPLVKVFIKIGAKTPAAFRAALKNPDKLSDLYKAVMNLKDASLAKADDPEPSVMVVDVAGLGTEASLFHAVSEYRVLGQPLIDIDWSQAK